MDRGAIIACEECKPELADEPDEKPQEDHKSIRVRVMSQRYAKPDGSFHIYVVALDGKPENWMPSGLSKNFSLTGPVGSMNRGDVVHVTGKFSSNPKYGLQFEALAAAQLAIKESEAGLLAFLARFPQIGRIRAEQIVRKLGGMSKVLDALENDPMKLTAVDGITEERAQEIKLAYDMESGYREFRLWASLLGMNERVIAAAIDEWGPEARAVIEEDPFCVMQFERVGFKQADELHIKLGGSLKHPRRCAAGVLMAIEQSSDEGHTYIDEYVLKGIGTRPARGSLADGGRARSEVLRLDLTPDEVEAGLVVLEQEFTRTRQGLKIIDPPKVVRALSPMDANGKGAMRVFLRELYQAEQSIAKELVRLSSAYVRPVIASESCWGSLKPAAAQRQALELACQQPVIVLTGQPGTGKSAIMRVILDVLESAGNRSVLCAPTGKAAKRLAELSGRPASTIHRLLGYRTTSSDRFMLEESVVTVDESSMASCDIFAQLCESVKTGARLIIVGDVDQLPSVGTGQVLHDIIESGIVPVVRLTEIFRQSSDGNTKRIPEVARDINNGECPDLHLKGTDVVFLPFEDTTLMQEKIVNAVVKQIPEKYGIPPEQVQVISPQKGELGKKNWEIGTKALNVALQHALNPKIDEEVFIGEGYVARAGDRVIHKKNNYDLQVMNGDQGIVARCSAVPFVPPAEVTTSIRTRAAKAGDAEERGGSKSDDCPVCSMLDSQVFSCALCSARSRSRPVRAPAQPVDAPTCTLIVDYGDQTVGYTKDECRELQLSYALTVHSSQGSSYKAVVMPIHDAHAFMLTRKMLYTGITRAEKYVLLIGQERRIAYAVRNKRGADRRTTLRELLEASVDDGVDERDSAVLPVNVGI